MKITVFLFALAFSLATSAELISTGVGVVRGQVITSREVQIDQMLELMLNDKAAAAKAKPLALDSKAFASATQDVLLQSVVALEAQNFNVVQVSPEELAAAERKVQQVLKPLPAWKQLQVTGKEESVALKRKLQAKKFIQFRAQSSVLPVTDAEAQRYFNENRLKFGNLPFENLKDNIKSFLSKAQVDKRLKDWYDLLLNKYQVKNLIAEI